MEKVKVVSVLNRLLEAELAGVVRYTHYSFLVFGYTRIPIVSWLREQASESLVHAQQLGEWITTLGAYPSLSTAPCLIHTNTTCAPSSLRSPRKLAPLPDTASCLKRWVAIEEFARQMIQLEEMHAAAVDKMLRKPGQVATHAHER